MIVTVAMAIHVEPRSMGTPTMSNTVNRRVVVGPAGFGAEVGAATVVGTAAVVGGASVVAAIEVGGTVTVVTTVSIAPPAFLSAANSSGVTASSARDPGATSRTKSA